jgi:hypothetical protein
MLTLRPAGLSSPAYRDWLDYVIVENRRNVGRLYERRCLRCRGSWRDNERSQIVQIMLVRPQNTADRPHGCDDLSIILASQTRDQLFKLLG